jgi:hypothetical protein
MIDDDVAEKFVVEGNKMECPECEGMHIVVNDTCAGCVDEAVDTDCGEHIAYNGDHVHEQHHAPDEHIGSNGCSCRVYIYDSQESSPTTQGG